MKSSIIVALVGAVGASDKYETFTAGTCNYYGGDETCGVLLSVQDWSLAEGSHCVGVTSTFLGAAQSIAATVTCSSTAATLTYTTDNALSGTTKVCADASIAVGVATFTKAEYKLLKDKKCAKVSYTIAGGTATAASMQCTTWTGAELCDEVDPPAENNSSDDAPHAAPAAAAVAMVAASLVMLQ